MLIEKVKKTADDLMPKVEELVNKVPELPASWSEKTADWLYYLIIIGVIFNGLALVMMLFMLLGGFGAMIAAPMMVGAVLGPIMAILVLLAGSFVALMLVLQLKALPLIKAKKLLGWRYLYYAVLVMIAGMLVSFNLIGAIFWGGVCFYILFNLKSYFK